MSPSSAERSNVVGLSEPSLSEALGAYFLCPLRAYLAWKGDRFNEDERPDRKLTFSEVDVRAGVKLGLGEPGDLGLKLAATPTNQLRKRAGQRVGPCALRRGGVHAAFAVKGLEGCIPPAFD